MLKRVTQKEQVNVDLLPNYTDSNKAVFVAWWYEMAFIMGINILLISISYFLFKFPIATVKIYFYSFGITGAIMFILYLFYLSGLCRCPNCNYIIFWYIPAKTGVIGEHYCDKVVSTIIRHHYFTCPKCGKSYRVKWKWENIKMNYDEPVDKE